MKQICRPGGSHLYVFVFTSVRACGLMKSMKIPLFFLFQRRTLRQAPILHCLAFAEIAYFGEKYLRGEHGL